MSALVFPNRSVEIGFWAVLLAGLLVAAWGDLRTHRVPNRLTVGLLAVGLVANLVRGAVLGADGRAVWAFDSAHPLLGAADGVLFGLCGAVVAFVAYTALYAVGGILGGGDVKLATAAGAWLGPKGVLLAAFVSVGTFTLFGLGFLFFELVRGVNPSLRPRRESGGGAKEGRNPVSYSLSFAAAVVILMVLTARDQIGLLPLVGGW